jgi:hypothetical protein
MASSFGKGLFVALAAALTVAVIPGASQAQPVDTSDVGILATHKSPFNCGKTFYANNWYPGHSPSGSIDWQSYGGDAIGGETVRATAGGTARFYSTLSSAGDAGVTAYGRYVVITHGDGTRTRYAHLATMVRSPGSSMSLTRGTVIGTVGASGGDYAPHLHYEQITALGQRRAITSTTRC